MSERFLEDNEKGRVGELAVFPFLAAEARAGGHVFVETTAEHTHSDYRIDHSDGSITRGEVKHCASHRLPFEVRNNDGSPGWPVSPDIGPAVFVRSFNGTRRYFRFNLPQVQAATQGFTSLPSDANFFEHKKGEGNGEGSAVAYISPFELLALGCGEELPKDAVEGAFMAVLGEHGTPENAQCYERYMGRLNFYRP